MAHGVWIDGTGTVGRELLAGVAQEPTAVVS